MISTHIIRDGGGATIIHDGAIHQVSSDHPNLDQITDLAKSGDYAEAVSKIDLRATVKQYIKSEQGFSIEDDRIVYDGYSFSDAVTEKVFRMIDRGSPADAVLNFMRKVCQNPSFSARHELLLFCEANNFLITRDGDILAFRGIRDDYTDHYTGTFDNSVGASPEMPRSNVNDDRRTTCAEGLHFGALSYMASMYKFEVDANGRYTGGRGRLVAVAVDPADVVSIPYDYHNAKGRCCRFTVVAEMTNKPALPDDVEVMDF